AGLPGLILASGVLLALARRRRKSALPAEAGNREGWPMSHKSALATALIRCKRLGCDLAGVLLAICLSFGPARADTIFNFAGTFIDSTTFSGTLTINLTAGQIDAANLLYGGNTYSTILLQEAFTGATASGQTPVPVGYGVFIGTSASALPRIDLLIPGTS